MHRSVLPLGLAVFFLASACGGSEKTDDTGPPADDTAPADDTGTPAITDADLDGVVEGEDCDDTDASLGAIADDGDCDGTLTADDCDDTDASLGAIADDGDCDGVLTADDCDDADASSTVIAEDEDCDGVLTADDCDDTDTTLGDVAEDQDCDGTLAADDCDDTDSTSTVLAEDADCDDAVTADDCDDEDSTLNLDDVDGDGSSTCDGDCDDADADFHPEASSDGLLADYDCDGTLSETSLAFAEYSFWGENESDYAGAELSGAGDVDGDGLADLLVNAYGSDDGGEDAGKVYLILGASLGTTSTIDLSLADYTFVGENAEDGLQAVSSAGDVDGDGLDDLLMSSVRNGDNGEYAGKAYLVFGASLGSTAEIDLSDADYSFLGDAAWDFAGTFVSGAGDVDGDGLDDLLVGAFLSDAMATDAGLACLFLGGSLGVTTEMDLSSADYCFLGENENDYAGSAGAGAGDVDGDGLDDIIVTAVYNDDGGTSAGKAYLILGSSLGATSDIELSDADYSFVGEYGGDTAGGSVAGVGDVDGDGLDDILVGAYGNDDNGSYAGKAYLVLGASLGSTDTLSLSDADYSFIGVDESHWTGHALSGAGDVDGDGLDDLVIGAWGYMDDELADTLEDDDIYRDRFGAAYLILASSLGSTPEIELLDAEYVFKGEGPQHYAGCAVAGAGDVDGDGLDDLFIGARLYDEVETSAGKAYLILSGL